LVKGVVQAPDIATEDIKVMFDTNLLQNRGHQNAVDDLNLTGRMNGAGDLAKYTIPLAI
jgi:hypothetical protein